MQGNMSNQGLQKSPDTEIMMQARPEMRQQRIGMVHRLPMDHELFAEGNLRRGLLAQQAAISQEDMEPAHSKDSSLGPK